ncbi:MAG: hypothetical protein RL660_381 [Bacteroidota bacterium]|jgi:pantoate--beta-alanine ligase
MLIFKEAADLHKYIDNQLVKGKAIGFVPTMGALHEGHISLINTSKKACELTVCSIFVNPTQFNNASDFAKYPITITEDIDLLSQANCDVLYLPSVEDVYPNGTDKLTNYDLAGLDTRLEGEFRPGHFQGVANVVHRLLNAVQPHQLFMGIKDYQQCKVVQQLLKVANIPTELVICPTLREASGLAMSSRNQRLSEQGKAKSAIIYKALNFIKQAQHQQSFEALAQQYNQMLTSEGLEPEHLILAESTYLQVLPDFNKASKMVLLTAAFCEGVRLIDNLEI